MADLPLDRALLPDPAAMAELGGPLPEEGLEPKLRGIVDEVARGEVWYSVIVPGEGDEPVGTVCIWEHEEDDLGGERISEIGWMVLPSHQGRGLASAAVREILERARAERRWGTIHAFPGVTNAPSNAICRKAGFRLLGERPIDYAGRTLRCNHWALEPAPSLTLRGDGQAPVAPQRKARVVRDLPGVPIGVDEDRVVATPVGGTGLARDPRAGVPRLLEHRIDLPRRAHVQRKRDAAPAARILDPGVRRELGAAPQPQGHATRLEEHRVLEVERGRPPQPLVERLRSRHIGDPEGDEADALIQAG